MRTFSKPIIVILSLMLMLLATACGAKSEPAKEAEKPAAGAGQEASSGVKTIKHALGTAEIKGTVKRVVALEWSMVEHLLAVGVQPAGIADIKGYNTWVNIAPKLDAGVVDVGSRTEPNLEAIAALKPDLIVAPDFRIKTSYEALNKIAPTIAFNPYPAEGEGNQYEAMINTFKTIADLTGKQAEADKVIADVEKSFAESKAKLKEKGKEGAEVVVTQAYSQQNAAVMRLFTDNSMLVQIMNRIGLKNAFKSSKYEANGFSTASVEALPAVQNANFIYIVQDNDNIFEKQLKDNEVWKGLTFVKENRTHKLPGNTWTFGGPLSAKSIADLVTNALTQ
ncbi:iron complex transport system substrate-binding protein [Paenibacillus sp. UNCCL117]|uniref:ABC transporter substrate-binding protein n=1 Tax=unclassified Paenibacillus TaxID=185978 RepID=UPI00087FD429|nr:MULTISPECIES: iron-siderophore ABC transporter substrate-binding protein [unclassified Paenibacillus]SDD65145.1 iron complex transport system substrate-binding protein [Paenibacillus sp. cl123]SFW58182.1 iron complex transport system substrate-binding protein [Paenibacillus sp. UNCCL117]